MLEAYRKERGADPQRIRVVEAILGLLESGSRADVDVERLATYRQVVRQDLPLDRRVVAAIVGLPEA